MILAKLWKKIIQMIHPPSEFMDSSFSQEGEDLVLKSFFGDRSFADKGFYVDVGAHHPFRFSNTYNFYKQGWSGINIDATPGSMALFKKYRKRDINLEIGVGSSRKPLTFFQFKEPALNTFDEQLAKKHEELDGYPISGRVQVDVLSLDSILESHLPSDIHIDFLTIDVEGFDFDVLRSNNWKKFRPRFILVETIEGNAESITSYLAENGYRPVGSTQRTKFFKTETH